MRWHERRGWVFDLDGTLVLAMHDFDGIKAQLGLPGDRPLLEGIHAQPAAAQPALWRAVHAWEASLVRRAQAAPDAIRLLDALLARRVHIGVLTRNTRETALATIEAAGLARYLHADDVVGRDCAPPKPSPAGVFKLLDRWGVPPHHAVMVGDDLTDVLAGQAAGAATLWLDRVGERRSPGVADLDVTRLDAVVEAL